jgi:hypothetical protein
MTTCGATVQRDRASEHAAVATECLLPQRIADDRRLALPPARTFGRRGSDAKIMEGGRTSRRCRLSRWGSAAAGEVEPGGMEGPIASYTVFIASSRG